MDTVKHSESTFRGSEGVELYYQCWCPEGEPRAVLAIVHGFGEHSGRYMNVVDHLVPRGFFLYSFDLRGHGRSPGQRGHVNEWKEYREDVRAFLRLVSDEQSGRSLFFMGHSLGGLIVLEYVLQDPKGLKGVIASAPILAQPKISPILFTISRILSRLWPRCPLDSRLDTTMISRDTEVVKAYREDPLVQSKGSPRLGTELVKAIEWTQAHAAEMRLPLLIVQGGADGLVPTEGSRMFFENVTTPDKEHHEYEGGYHEPHNDIIYEQVMKDLEQWLDKHL